MSKEQNNNESENVLEIMDKLNSSNTSNDNSSFGSDVSDEVLILRERMLAAEDALRIEIENRKNAEDVLRESIERKDDKLSTVIQMADASSNTDKGNSESSLKLINAAPRIEVSDASSNTDFSNVLEETNQLIPVAVIDMVDASTAIETKNSSDSSTNTEIDNIDSALPASGNQNNDNNSNNNSNDEVLLLRQRLLVAENALRDELNSREIVKQESRDTNPIATQTHIVSTGSVETMTSAVIEEIMVIPPPPPPLSSDDESDNLTELTPTQSHLPSSFEEITSMKAKATILSPGPTANTNLNRNNNELNGKQLSEERREMTEERNAILSELKIYEENIESHNIEFNVTPSPIPSSANKGKNNEQEGLKIDSNYHSPSSADAVSAAQRIREHLELLNQADIKMATARASQRELNALRQRGTASYGDRKKMKKKKKKVKKRTSPRIISSSKVEKYDSYSKKIKASIRKHKTPVRDGPNNNDNNKKKMKATKTKKKDSTAIRNNYVRNKETKSVTNINSNNDGNIEDDDNNSIKGSIISNDDNSTIDNKANLEIRHLSHIEDNKMDVSPARERDVLLKSAVLTPISENVIAGNSRQSLLTGRWSKGTKPRDRRGNPTVVHLHRSGSIEISMPISNLDDINLLDEYNTDDDEFDARRNNKEMANSSSNMSNFQSSRMPFENSFSGTSTIGDRAFLLRQRLRKQTESILH